MRNIVLSPNRLNKIQSCPRKFFFGHVMNKSMIDKPIYFTEGEFLHFILDLYYRSKIDGTTNIDQIVEKARNYALKLPMTMEMAEATISLFKEYISFHQNESWTIEGSEVPFAKVLFEDEKADLRVIIQGKIDLLVTNTQGIKLLVDHKKISQNRQPIERDNQILAYCWATDRRDFVINQLGTQKTLKPVDKFKRHYFNIVDHQIEEWVEITIFSALEITRFYEKNFFPARITACNYQGHKCEFFDVCQTTQDNWNYKLEAGFQNHEDHDLMASISEG